MNKFLFLLVPFITISAFADCKTTMRNIEKWELKESYTVDSPEHAGKILYHKDLMGYPITTEYSVLIYHGLFNSPRNMEALAQDFFERGSNVINARLLDHYDRKDTDLENNSDYRHWLNQSEEQLKLAKQLGKKVILVGHSTGGVLVTWLAARHPEAVAALVLYSPSFEIQRDDLLTAWVAEQIHYIKRKDGRILSGHAGLESEKLTESFWAWANQRDLQGLLKDIPIFTVNTVIDKTVKMKRGLQFMTDMIGTGVNVPREQFIYTREDGVLHNETAFPVTKEGNALPFQHMLNQLHRFFAGEDRRIEIQGHRGGMGLLYPENSLEAFQASAQRGNKVLELDIHMTKDAQLVVHHDAFLDVSRLKSPRGNIESLNLHNLTSGELDQVRLGFTPQVYRDTAVKVPTLDSVLDLAKDYPQLKFSIEIKYSDMPGDFYQKREVIADAFIEKIKARGLIDRVILQSFDKRVLQYVRDVAPSIKLSYLYKGESYKLPSLDAVGSFLDSVKPEYFSPSYEIMQVPIFKGAFLKRYPKYGRHFGIILWSADSPSRIRKFDAEFGLDAVIVNDVESTKKGLGVN